MRMRWLLCDERMMQRGGSSLWLHEQMNMGNASRWAKTRTAIIVMQHEWTRRIAIVVL